MCNNASLAGPCPRDYQERPIHMFHRLPLLEIKFHRANSLTRALHPRFLVLVFGLGILVSKPLARTKRGGYNNVMVEGQNLEAEIALLSLQIKEKQAELLREHGSEVAGREALHHVLGEQINAQVSNALPIATKNKASPAKSYLDDLDPADIEKVNALVDLIPKLGLKKTIEQAKSEPAYILDAFHDALVDKLHSELKQRNLI